MKNLRKLMPVTVMIAVGITAAIVSWPGGASAGPGAASDLAGAGHHGHRLAVDPAAASVRPVTACAQLASGGHDFSNVPDAPTIVATATTTTSGGDSFCDVTGYIAPQEAF